MGDLEKKVGSVQPGQPGCDSVPQEQGEALPEVGKMDARKVTRKVTKGEGLRQTDEVELHSSFSVGEKRRPVDRPVEVVSTPLESDIQAFQKLNYHCSNEQRTLKKAYAQHERDLLLEESLQTLEDFTHILESQAYCERHPGPDPFEALRNYKVPGGLRVEVILEPENRPFTLIPFKERNCDRKMYERLVQLCQELLEEYRQEHPVKSDVNDLIENVETTVREKALSLLGIIDDDLVDGWFEQLKPQSPGFTLRGSLQKVQSFLKGDAGVRSCAVCCHRKPHLPDQNPSLSGKVPQGETLPAGSPLRGSLPDSPQHSLYSSQRSDPFSDSGSLTSSEASYESREWTEPLSQKGEGIEEGSDPEREAIQGMTMLLPPESEEDVFDEETEVKRPFGHSPEVAQARSDANPETIEFQGKIIDHNHPRYKTTPHFGNYYGGKDKSGWLYGTRDVKKTASGGLVAVEVYSGQDPARKTTNCLRYEYVTTETDRQAVSALEEKMGFDLTQGSTGKLKEQLAKMKSTDFPPIHIIRGDVGRQREHVIAKAKEKGSRVVICNASQLNYQEQLEETHNIQTGIKRVYGDHTFGPGMVKAESGGPELLAHTLVGGNNQPFCGALADFFEAFLKENPDCQGKIWNEGGYYHSIFTPEDWALFAKALAESDTRVEGFAWSAAEEGGSDEVKVYQTGGINSGNSASAHYWSMHEESQPPEFVEFLIIFLQVRNALLKEASRGESVVFHSTRIGEGVFGNTEHVSALAHLYAYRSLPESVRGNIQSINIGTYHKKETDQLGKYLGHLKPGLVDLS